MQTHKYTHTYLHSHLANCSSVFVQRCIIYKNINGKQQLHLAACWHTGFCVSSELCWSSVRKCMEVSPCPPPEWTPIHSQQTLPHEPQRLVLQSCFTQYFFSPTLLRQSQLETSKRKMCLHTNICMSTQIIVFEFLFYNMLLCGASGFCCRNWGLSDFDFVFLLLSVWFGFC